MPERKEQKKLRRILEGLDKKWLKYEPKEKKHINWSAYTEAQVYEIINVLNMIKNIVDEAVCYVPVDVRPGRQFKSLSDKAKAILVQQYFQTSNRVTAGLMRLFRKNLGIEESVYYKDIERAYDNPDVQLIIQKALELTNDVLKDKEKDFSIDGTGLETSIKQNYEMDKDDEKSKKSWEKAIWITGNEYKLITAMEIADGTDNECPYLIPLLDDTMRIYEELNIFAGDPAYLSRENCNAIKSYGGIPRIYPKKNSSIKSRSSKPWKEMLLEFVNNTQGWLREYHIRSISESNFSVLKRIFSRPLLKVLKWRRKFEGFARGCVYNIRRLNYIHALYKVNIRWL